MNEYITLVVCGVLVGIYHKSVINRVIGEIAPRYGIDPTVIGDASTHSGAFNIAARVVGECDGN